MPCNSTWFINSRCRLKSECSPPPSLIRFDFMCSCGISSRDRVLWLYLAIRSNILILEVVSIFRPIDLCVL